MGHKEKTVVFLIVLITIVILFPLNSVNSQTQLSQITINPDGSVVGTDKIHQNGNIYTLTGNLNGSIIIEKDNISLDGAGFTLQGPENLNLQETGVSLNGKTGVVIENLILIDFYIDIDLINSSKCIVSSNKIYGNNSEGIVLNNSWNNWIKQNYVEETRNNGIGVHHSNDNFISQNKILSGGIFVGSEKGINFLAGINNVISDNILDNSGIDIESSNNTIIGNTISNSSSGISLYNHASTNLLLKNNISNCTFAIGGGDTNINNTITGNNIVGNYAVALYNGIVNDTFVLNNFINNTKVQITVPSNVRGSSPRWDNGTFGNYYSDYLVQNPNAKEVDGTGAYNTPYTITVNDTYLVPHTYQVFDNHPLVNPVEISQPPIEVPSWITSTPKPTNQAIPTLYVVILVVVGVFVISAVVFLLLYRRRRKTANLNKVAN